MPRSLQSKGVANSAVINPMEPSSEGGSHRSIFLADTEEMAASKLFDEDIHEKRVQRMICVCKDSANCFGTTRDETERNKAGDEEGKHICAAGPGASYFLLARRCFST